MLFFFKVWNASRCLKTALVLEGDLENLLQALLQAANQKLGITATKIVLEECGTVIDDEEVLKHVKDHVLILLQEGEEWSKGTLGQQPSPDQTINREGLATENATNLGLKKKKTL